MNEIDIRITELKYASRTNVLTTPSNLKALFPNVPEIAINNLKTVVIFNNSGNDLFFGHDSSVTTSTGSIIKHSTFREIPFKNWDLTPYFIAEAIGDIAIEMYS